jgi:hypothetical protein
VHLFVRKKIALQLVLPRGTLFFCMQHAHCSNGDTSTIITSSCLLHAVFASFCDAVFVIIYVLVVAALDIHLSPPLTSKEDIIHCHAL